MSELKKKAHGKMHGARPGNGRRRKARAGVLAVMLGLSASVIAAPPKKAESIDLARSAAKISHWFQIGKASWYGKQFQGRKTADGEKFDMNAFTCAHRTLPMGSWVRVTNLSNRKSMLVRVNDRGPVPENRIVDLSYAAARKLGVSGLTKVKIEQVKPNDAELLAELTEQPMSLVNSPLVPNR